MSGDLGNCWAVLSKPVALLLLDSLLPIGNGITENSYASPYAGEQILEDLISEMLPNHGRLDSQTHFSDEEVRETLETSACTGKFWQDWIKLKSILSYHLKQVLSQYPEAEMSSEQQISSLGETFLDMVKRLDDALNSFGEGPPFTLQRLCEILLSARSIYPKLSKLALALEKILLVTSTLTVSVGHPCTLVTEQSSNGYYEHGSPRPQTSSVENGVMHSVLDGDEIMVDVQQDSEVVDGMAVCIETIDNTVRSTETNPAPMVDSVAPN